MVRKSRVFLLAFLLCLLVSFNSKAQNEKDKKLLAELLTQLETSHNYQFNYTKETIENVRLEPPNFEWSFNQILEYLNTETGLIFSILNDNFVSIKKIDSLFRCGYIKSKETPEPLVSATIQSKNHSTISDEHGFFEIQVDSNDEKITIRHLGFRTHVLRNSTNDACSIIYMDDQLQSLSEVVISDYITSGINKLNTGSYEIDIYKFDILPGLIEADVLQSVQAFPGIQSENETVSNINIRGGAHDQNLILWDDIKMYQSGHFFGLISMFNPQITQKVSLLKNGTDVSFTDGTSGTISMKTEDDVNKKFNGNIGANFIDANGFVDVPLGEKSSIQIAARKSISEFVETPTYKAFFERISQNTEVEANSNNSLNSDKQFDFYDTSLRWIYKITPKDEVRVNFINVANELIFNENATINEMEESRESNVSQNSIAGGFQYERTWDDRWHTIFSIYESDYRLKAVNANILDSQRFLQENKVSETGTKLITYFRINKRFQLLGGHHFVETKVTNLDDVDNPLFRSLVSEVLRTYAAYSQVNFGAVNKMTNFSFGLRYNYLDKFKKSIIEPRLSFNQRFFNYFTLEILGEFKHQNMSQVINFQSDFLGIEKRRWQLSNNTDIPVVESKQLSLGIIFNHDGWLLSTEAYLKNVDGITTQSQGFQNQYEFVRTSGSYDVQGMDVLLRKRFGSVNTWLSYSYMNNVYRFRTLPETEFPSNFDIEHTITFGLNYATKSFKIASGFNWHTGMPVAVPDTNNPVVDGEINYDATNASRLNDYLRVDISAVYDFGLSDKMSGSIGMSVWNLLNQKNIIGSTYRLHDGNVGKIDFNSLGVTPNFVFRLFF